MGFNTEDWLNRLRYYCLLQFGQRWCDENFDSRVKTDRLGLADRRATIYEFKSIGVVIPDELPINPLAWRDQQISQLKAIVAELEWSGAGNTCPVCGVAKEENIGHVFCRLDDVLRAEITV